MKIGIIGAMSIEVEALKEKLGNVQTETVSGIDFFSGSLCGKEVVVAKCGIGKVFAAICAQTMILRFGVTHIINTGIAGTLTEELDILDVAIADGVVQHDMDNAPNLKQHGRDGAASCRGAWNKKQERNSCLGRSVYQ